MPQPRRLASARAHVEPTAEVSHVEPTAEVSGSGIDMGTPSCQPSAALDRGAPNSSASGWSIDPASVGQSHCSQSSVSRTIDASLHLAFGLGSGWTLVDAMMIETARMGQTQPESLRLATWLTAWGTTANVLVVPLFYYLQRLLNWRVERWVWVGLLLQLSSAVLAALSSRSGLEAPSQQRRSSPPLPPGTDSAALLSALHSGGAALLCRA